MFHSDGDGTVSDYTYIPDNPYMSEIFSNGIKTINDISNYRHFLGVYKIWAEWIDIVLGRTNIYNYFIHWKFGLEQGPYYTK